MGTKTRWLGPGAPKSMVTAWLLPAGAVFLCALVVALLLGSGMTLIPFGLKEQPLVLAEAQMEGMGFAGDGLLELPVETETTLYSHGETGSLTFDVQGQTIKTVGISVGRRAEGVTPVEVALYRVAVDARGEEYLTHLGSALLSAGGGYNTAVLKCQSGPDTEAIRLVFSGYRYAFHITGVTLNANGFSFNARQALLLFAVGLALLVVVKSRLYAVTYDAKEVWHRLLFLGAVAGCIVLLLALTVGVTQPGGQWLQPYNQDTRTALMNSDVRTKFYNQLFDAFYNGRLWLDISVGPALEGLANVYDPVQRAGLMFFNDLTYYGGRYYSYFGPAPMLLYFPLYWLTGCLPSIPLACLVPAALAVLLLGGALLELVRHFDIKANLLLLVLGYLALVSGSLLFVLVAGSENYEQASLWAMLALAGFVWAFFGGLRRQAQPVRRRLLLALAGLFVVLVAASRPAVLLLCIAFALPRALAYLRGGEKLPGKLADALVFLLPVAAGAALLMAYNHLRFGSVLEFGITYQLTSFDVTTKTFRFSPVYLVQALLVYGFTFPAVLSEFPFVQMNASQMLNFGNQFTNSYFIGYAALPLYWGLGGTARVLRRKPLEKKALYIGVMAAACVILWVSFCMTNVMYRYFCDAAVGLGLLAALVLLEVLGGDAAQRRKGLYGAACLMCVVTMAVGFLLCFSNRDLYIQRLNPDVYIAVARLLRLG